MPAAVRSCGGKSGSAYGNLSNIAATVAGKKNTLPMPTRKVAELKSLLTPEDVDRIIQMAWEDRTPFDAIRMQFGLSEAEVIALMKAEMRLQNWKKWRARVQGRATKHAALRDDEVLRFKSRMQKTITLNRISKR